MAKRRISLMLFVPILLCAGPCENLETEAVDGGEVPTDCAPSSCLNHVEVNLVRADNGPFEDGYFEFAGTYPDFSVAQSYCLYDTAIPQLECENAGLIATVDSQGRIFTLVFPGTPEWITVSVAYNGGILGEVAVEPGYTHAPDGDASCPSPCWSAHEIVTVHGL